jgi:hypothetical protein
MTRLVKQQLAKTLGIKPEQILTCREYADGYSIITMDFKKFTAVQPAALEPVDPPVGAGRREQNDNSAVSAATAAQELPEKLQEVYDDPNPDKWLKKDLVALSKALDLPPRAGMNKADLVREIELFKTGQYTEPGTRGGYNHPTGTRKKNNG